MAARRLAAPPARGRLRRAGRAYTSRVAFVYMLRCADGSLYTGVAKDLAARVRAHEAGRASRYTRAHLPVALVWWQEVGTWADALREEMRIKGLTRRAKEALLRAPAACGPGPA
jgi:putative endonuclease